MLEAKQAVVIHFIKKCILLKYFKYSENLKKTPKTVRKTHESCVCTPTCCTARCLNAQHRLELEVTIQANMHTRNKPR